MSRPGPYGPGRDCRLPAIVQPSPQQQPPQLLLLQPQPPQFPPPQQQHRMIRMSTIHRQPPPKPLLQPITSTSCKIWCSEGLPSGHSPSYAARTAWCAEKPARSPKPRAGGSSIQEIRATVTPLRTALTAAPSSAPEALSTDNRLPPVLQTASNPKYER